MKEEKKGSGCQCSYVWLVIRHIKRLYKQPTAPYKATSMAGATLRRENNKSLLFLQPTHTVTTKNILFCQSKEQPSHSGTD